MPIVQEVMTPEPIRVSGDTALAECARLLLDHRIRHLPVVDQTGAPVAVVTDMDVFSRGTLTPDEDLWMAWDAAAERLTAGDIATGAFIRTGADNDLGAVCARMVRHEADCALVVGSDDRLLGILTEHDGVRWSRFVLDPSTSERLEASSPARTIDRDTSALDALDQMRAHRARHLIVTDAGKLFGVLSIRDILTQAAEPGRPPTAGFLSTSGRVHFLAVGDPLGKAADLMLEHHIGCLPVVEPDGTPCRVLTRADLIAATVAADQDLALFSDEEQVD